MSTTGQVDKVIVWPLPKAASCRPIEAKFHVQLLWVERMKACSNSHGHKTDMTAMPIYGKKLLKIYYETSRPMTCNLGVQHQGLGPSKVCSNADPGLTLTYFTAMLPNAFVLENA